MLNHPLGLVLPCHRETAFITKSLDAPIVLHMQFISFVVSGIAEQPGVFGWLMIRSFDDVGCCTLAGSLSFSISELTVGIYEEIAKSERHEPGGDRPVGVYIPAG